MKVSMFLFMFLLAANSFSDTDCSEEALKADVRGDLKGMCRSLVLSENISIAIMDINSELDRLTKIDSKNADIWIRYKSNFNEYVVTKQESINTECSIINSIPYNYGSGQSQEIKWCSLEERSRFLKLLVDILNLVSTTTP